MESNDLISKFRACLQADRNKHVKDWLISWEYQEKKMKRGVVSEENLPENFFDFKGKEDLVKWMNWFEADFPNYFPDEMTKELINKSHLNDKKVLANLNVSPPLTNYNKRIGLHNAEDFLYPQLYPVPERYKPRNILDFGAGYGRQANLWTSNGDKVYIGMDAIPMSYSLQNLYYKSLGGHVVDYIESPADFRIELSRPGIYHLPTWRHDLIPDNSIDLIICVQVLPELNSKLAKNMIRIFQQKLKPGGMLYIRDHGNSWKPAGKIDIDHYLQKCGFSIEFYPHIIDRKDLHGMVRIWRKDDPLVINSRRFNPSERKRQLIEDADTMLSGALSKLKRKVKK